MTIDERISYFLNSKSNVIQYETIQIKHPNFVGTLNNSYWIVRNNSEGLTAILEPDAPGNGATVTFDYYPLQISLGETRDNLDFNLEIVLGDLGEVLPTELANVLAADDMHTKPIFRYRTFRSDDLTQPLYGPVELEIRTFNFDKRGVTFKAEARKFNRRGTGLLYRIVDIPMLAGGF